MFIRTEEIELVEHDWTCDELLVTVAHSHWCKRCHYSVLIGSQAVKCMGEYWHYPKCPKSARENKTYKGARTK